jgi:hypothetical protein
MANTTLGAIRDKVRRITRSPSPSQLTDAQLDEYVNTFILYDFPEDVRLFSLRTNLTFYTQPYVDVYQTTYVDPFDPLYQFKNRYLAVHQPAYIAGVQAFYSQDRTGFFATWPKIDNISDTGLRGNGTAGPYIGTLAAFPVMQNEVIFTATDATGRAMIMTDTPSTNILGALGPRGTTQVIPSFYGQINYITGVFSVTFIAPVPAGVTIYSETVPYQAAKPIGILYYDSKFTIRPVPNMAYPVAIEVDARPTELLLVTDVPGEKQWWQYVALGACIKIFQDRSDFETLH